MLFGVNEAFDSAFNAGNISGRINSLVTLLESGVDV